MSHLSSEDLARLVDDPMTTHEIAHVSRCVACMSAIEEMRAQTGALRALAPIAPPATAWSAIERRVSGSAAIRMRRAWWPERRRRVAANAMWMLIGAGVQAALVAIMFSSAAGARQWVTVLGGASNAANVSALPPQIVDTLGQDDSQSPEEALRAAEGPYRVALSKYAAISSVQQSGDPTSALAALDAMIAVTSAALEHAPADPLVNGWHVALLGERDALMRQIGGGSALTGPGGGPER